MLASRMRAAFFSADSVSPASSGSGASRLPISISSSCGSAARGASNDPQASQITRSRSSRTPLRSASAGRSVLWGSRAPARLWPMASLPLFLGASTAADTLVDVGAAALEKGADDQAHYSAPEEYDGEHYGHGVDGRVC